MSDRTWRVADGPIRFNSLYLGEVFDARHDVPGWDRPGFDDRMWRQPSVASGAVGQLHAQVEPPIKITATLNPVAVSEPRSGVFIFDMGQNFAGWVRLTLTARSGTQVVLRYGEILNPDGTLNPLTSVAGQVKGARQRQDGARENRGGGLTRCRVAD